MTLAVCRLVSVISNHDARGLSTRKVHEGDHVIHKAAENLIQTEQLLDDCLSSLNHYTGHLLAHISWTCPQSNPDIRVSGYRVMIDGQMYGATLQAGVKNIRIKVRAIISSFLHAFNTMSCLCSSQLGLAQASHELSVIAVSDHPPATSAPSNVVELLTKPFRPFAFFSFLTQDPKYACTFDRSIDVIHVSLRSIWFGLKVEQGAGSELPGGPCDRAQEDGKEADQPRPAAASCVATHLHAARHLRGRLPPPLPALRTPTPHCYALLVQMVRPSLTCFQVVLQKNMNIFTARFRCQSSQKTLEWFVRYAKTHSSQVSASALLSYYKVQTKCT